MSEFWVDGEEGDGRPWRDFDDRIGREDRGWRVLRDFGSTDPSTGLYLRRARGAKGRELSDVDATATTSCHSNFGYKLRKVPSQRARSY